ncbi:craniofacial development protein 2-like [Saccostrea echinata]|uniref:craniofacial development protein 2-like n=1 Tax=Saccostrea echinata TaxID=191078 RepID=UPI002A82F65E|nr:craniofacial development protein 2-like [Saccostrea echinata]
MKQYNLSLLAMSEVRWTGTGKQRLNSGKVIIWSGRSDNNHHEGVALLISQKFANTVLQRKPINERLLYVRLNSLYTKVSIVSAYAPTDSAEEEAAKDNFYSSLHAVLNDIPRHDVMLLMGDSIARVGQINHNRRRVMGQHAVGDLKDNGERLISICEVNDFVIGGSLFAHKTIHKLTWTSPDGRTKSQIDHILINSKWRHSLQDVRAMRHADIGSDHNLVIAKICLKLRKAKIGTSNSKRFDVSKLKDPSRHAKSERLSKDTWTTIEERKQLKKNLIDAKSPRLKDRAAALYRKKDKEVKKSARRDRRYYMEQLAEEAQEAAERKDMKTVYQITKKLRGDHGPNQDLPAKAEDGSAITEELTKL